MPVNVERVKRRKLKKKEFSIHKMKGKTRYFELSMDLIECFIGDVILILTFY